MCGINAILALDPALSAASVRATVADMNRQLTHRGPDEEGIWSDGPLAIGHTRLRVIAPSGGQQPRQSSSQILAFNGEIYNYQQLRSQLTGLGCSFRDESDTEVLAVALEFWGPAAIDKLHGDFAFVSYDRAAGKILLGRDRLGVKPLYFSVSAAAIIISSEPKGILAATKTLHPQSQPRISRLGLVQTLLYGNPLPPQSCFADITALRGGQWLGIDVRTGRVSQNQYWELTASASNSTDPELQITELLTQAVSERQQSDVDYAMLLSGGLDSSLIAYLVRELDRPHRAYTIGERNPAKYTTKSHMIGSDHKFAHLVAEQTGHQLHSFDDLGGNTVDYVRRCTRARDALVTLANDMPMLKLFERIKGKDTVVLSGEGADEAFLGYFYQRDTSGKVGPFFSSPRAPIAFRLLNPRFLKASTATDLARESFDTALAHLPAEIRSDNRKLIHYLQLRFTLPFVLDRADRLSASQSLEVRVPYCDHRLVEYVFGLPDSLKYTQIEKELLRKSFSGRFDERVIARPKSVFPFAENEAQCDELRREVARIITSARKHGGLVADVYRLPALWGIVTSKMIFRRFIAAIGSFHAQAFLCQIISLDELEQSYGLTTTGEQRL